MSASTIENYLENDIRNELEHDLAIVIVSYNTCELLRKCLLALPEATEGLKTEIWVVDNNSSDDSAQMVASEFPNVTLLANKTNPGFAHANNQALRQSSARHALLLNPDTEAQPGALTRMLRYLESNPNVGAVGPKLLNSDGTLQRNGQRFPTIRREFLVTTGLNALSNAVQKSAFNNAEYMRADFDVTCEVDLVSGACLMTRDSVLKEIGLLDEAFFMFYEEIEWCWRLKRAGYSVAYIGEAQVVHHWMGSVRQLGRSSAAHLRRSACLYYGKTGGPVASAAIRLVLILAAFRSEILHRGAAGKRFLRTLRQ